MDFLGAIESLASASELREVGRYASAGRVPVVALQEKFGLWLSLVERLPRVQEVQGSNPCSPTFCALVFIHRLLEPISADILLSSESV